jgi:hypothetical protein
MASVAMLALLGGCRHEPGLVADRLLQRGYLWQRQWTPAVDAAVAEASRRLDGVILLGADIEWREGTIHVVRPAIRWENVRAHQNVRALALRIAPFAKAPPADREVVETLATAMRDLLADARAHGVVPDEVQLDYDCPQRELARYRNWLRELRPAASPIRLTITTLPSWLEEPEFPRLLREVDGWVLQVHSIATANGTASKLCETAAARRWVERAARFHLPFSVALPTYRCEGGYDRDGRLLGVAMDSVEPAWPAGTRVLSFAADADEIAGLVSGWQRAHPRELRELIWYRVPVASDLRNWRWPTLSAVMAGREPKRSYVVSCTGENPVDLSLRNAGESDDTRLPSIAASWSGARLLAADALAGWNINREEGRSFFEVAEGRRLSLPPGAACRIGWLRFSERAQLQLEVMDEKEKIR